MTLDITDLRTKQAKTDLGMHVWQPVTLLSAQVNGSPDRGARTFNYDSGTGSGFSTIANGMTIIFQTQYGEQRTFIKSITGNQTSGTILFYENSLVLTNNDQFSILHLVEPYPQPPSIRGGVFYKFFDGTGITYTDQNSEPLPMVIMGTHRVSSISSEVHSLSLQVTVGGDDGYTNSTFGGSIDTSGPDVLFGDSGSGIFNSFFRFQNVTIPQGATIASATLRVVSAGTQTGSLVSTISGNDEDNATAPTTYAGYNAKVLTSATVAWNTAAAWPAESAFTSPSIITIVQEIVNRVGWDSGNALMLFIKDNGSGTVYRDVYSVNGSATKAAILTITYTVNATFDLDASNSYPLAQGATISSYLWACVHNGGGTSGVTIVNSTSATAILILEQEDQYLVSCTVTDSNGKGYTSYRCYFTTPPYTDFTLQSLTGDWDTGGWRCTVNVTSDQTLEDFPDWSLVVLSWTNYFDNAEGYVNLWGISDEILLCAYIRQDTDSDNWGSAESGGGTSAVSFSLTTIEDVINNLSPLGSVSLEAKASPAFWYEYASWMTVGRSVHHLIAWHSANIIRCVDILYLTNNGLGVQMTDYTESSLLQQANSFAYNKGIFAKLVCDRLGRVWLVQDAQMLDDAARAALETLFTIEAEDVSGVVQVVRDPEAHISFTQLDGFSFNGTTATPFITIVPGYRETGTSYIMPDSRGSGTAQVSSQVLEDADDAKNRVGRYHALQNNNPREARFTTPSNYLGAFDIIPIYWYEWGIPDLDLGRDTPLNGRLMVCRNISVTQTMNEQATYGGSLGVEVALQPEARGPDGIEGNYPTSYPPQGNGPGPDWNPPDEDEELFFLVAYEDAT